MWLHKVIIESFGLFLKPHYFPRGLSSTVIVEFVGIVNHAPTNNKQVLILTI